MSSSFEINKYHVIDNDEKVKHEPKWPKNYFIFDVTHKKSATPVAIGNPKRHVRKASHCSSKQQ